MLAMLGLPPYLNYPIGDFFTLLVKPMIDWAVVSIHVYLPKIHQMEELRSFGLEVGLFDEVIIV